MQRPPYIFTSERLGFRNWSAEDVEPMAAISADPKVMEFFTRTKSREETIAFIERMQTELLEKSYCYFAVDILETNEFIGFIGLSDQTFESDFTPCTDIGWRLAKEHWNKGFATEGAKACLRYAFGQLGLKKISSIAAKVNTRSELVMLKIGMHKLREFKHPLLAGDKRLEDCVWYEIENNS